MNRAAEILDGIKEDLLDNRIPFTENEVHLNTISTYHTTYESSLPPLSEYEYNKYQYAKSLFQLRQFDSVSDVLGNSKSPKLYFLRLYAKYLVIVLLKLKENVVADLYQGNSLEKREKRN